MSRRLVVAGLDGHVYLLPAPAPRPRPRCECGACDLGLHWRRCTVMNGIQTYRRLSDGTIERLCAVCAQADLMADYIEEVEA